MVGTLKSGSRQCNDAWSLPGVAVQPRRIFPLGILGQKHEFVAEALWRWGPLSHWLFHKQVLGSVSRLTKAGNHALAVRITRRKFSTETQPGIVRQAAISVKSTTH